jgi:hypothetical protein
MNLDFLLAYHELIKFCQENKMYDRDCVIFVREDDDKLIASPVSISDDDSTDNYFSFMSFGFRETSLRYRIHIEPFDSAMSTESLRQLRPDDLREGTHVFKYICDRLVIMSRTDMVSFDTDQ